MQSNRDSALKVAEFLLQIKAVKLQPESPFTWASGWKSPIYCDNRKTLSYPGIRTFIRQEFTQRILDEYGKPDVIAGVATGAIGIGILVAEYLGLPFIYVRPEAKSHGRQNQIEGQLNPNQTVVIVEDLISTGKSSLNGVDALDKAGAQIKGMLAIFTYGFEVAVNNFESKGVSLNTLTDYQNVIEQATETNYVKEEQQKMLLEWRENPSGWQQ